MPPPYDFDEITNDLTAAVIKIVATCTGWGTLTGGAAACYNGGLLPFPEEPFPGAWIYHGGTTSDYSQGNGTRRDNISVVVRILGGPLTPSYKFDPEAAVKKQLTKVTNALSYRRFLEDPVSNVPFRYIDPQFKFTVQPVSRIRPFDYGQLGKFVGVEIPCTVGLFFRIGRAS